VHKRWEELHFAIVRFVSSQVAVTQFQSLPGSGFDDLAALYLFLVGQHGDLDERDRVYSKLVRTIQLRGPAAHLAFALAWSGLWPGLDGIYLRRLRYFRDDPDDLAAEIAAAFTQVTARLQLRRVQRVAATIVRSVDREVMVARQRFLRELARRGAAAKLAGAGPDLAPLAGLRAAPETAPRYVELVGLRARLAERLGVDSDPRDLTDAAVRMRFRRIMAQLSARRRTAR